MSSLSFKQSLFITLLAAIVAATIQATAYLVPQFVVKPSDSKSLAAATALPTLTPTPASTPSPRPTPSPTPTPTSTPTAQQRLSSPVAITGNVTDSDGWSLALLSAVAVSDSAVRINFRVHNGSNGDGPEFKATASNSYLIDSQTNVHYPLSANSGSILETNPPTVRVGESFDFYLVFQLPVDPTVPVVFQFASYHRIPDVRLLK